MDERAAGRALSALERYRDGPPRHPRSYPDLHEHVLALARAGLLVVVDEPINKDTEMHPLVRWQYRGGIPEPERKAFLFTQPTDSKGRRFDISVLVAGLAANRDVYRIGFGKPLDEIGPTWVKAIADPMPPRVVTRRAVPGGGARPAATSIATAARSTACRCRSRRPAGTTRLISRPATTSPRTPTPASRTSATIADSSRRRAGSG